MKTPILIAGWSTGPSTSAVNYLPGLASPSSNTSVAWFSTLANAQTPVAVAGSFENLVVSMPTALTQGSYTVTLVLNGVDQALSVVVNTTSGQTVADAAHSISVAAGDKVALKITPSGTPISQAQIQFAMVFETTGSNGALFAHCQGANSSGTNTFTAPGCYSSNGQTASTQRTAVMPCAGSISVLYANLSAAPGTGLNRTVTLVKNGVDQTALTISDAATDGSVTFGTAVSFATGDTLTIRCGTTTTTAAHIKISTDWTPTNANEVPVFGLWSSVPGTTATAFSPLNGTAIGTETTETNTQNIAPVAFTITAFRADIGTAPGNAKSRAFTVRQNAANSATTVTISGNASTTASWSGTLSIAAADLLAVSEVPSGTPSGAGNAKVSAVIKAPDSSASLSGQSVTTSIGSLLASTSMPMTGGAVVAAQGAVLQGASLTGQAIGAAQGSAVSVTSVALTGQAVSAAQGQVLQGAPVVGQTLAVAQGSSGLALTIALTGQSLSVASGTVTMASSFVISGQSLASTQGSLTASPSTALIGHALAAAQGAFTLTISPALTGQAAVIQSGILAPAFNRVLTSGEITAARASVVPTFDATLGGQSLIADHGSTLPNSLTELLGNEIVVTTDNVVAANDVTVELTGVSTFIAQSLIDPAAIVALVGSDMSAALGLLEKALGAHEQYPLAGVPQPRPNEGARQHRPLEGVAQSYPLGRAA